MEEKKRSGRPKGSVVYKKDLGPGGYRNGVLQDMADNPGRGPRALASQKENAGEFRNAYEKDAYIQAVKTTRRELKSISHDVTKPINPLAAVMDLHDEKDLDPRVGSDGPLAIGATIGTREAHELQRIEKRGKGRPRKS